MRATELAPTAECYWCGRDYAVRADGTVRHHRDIYGDSFTCKGSRKPPKKMPQAEGMEQREMQAAIASALRAAADDLDALQTPDNEHYSQRDPALWLHDRADAIERA